MLDTLASLGEQINKNKSKFDEIIEFEPKIDADKKNYCLNIIFDIDKEEIIVSSENLEEFDPTESSSTHYLLKTFSARSGKTYVAALLGKIEHLKVSLFGKVDETKGQFVNDIDKKYPGIKDSLFYKALTSIYEIKDKASTLDKNEINKLLGIGGNESVVFCYSSIRNSSLGIDHLTELSSLPGYEVFLNKKFFDQKENEKESLCYASGKKQKNVKVSEYRSRNSMSAMFVQSTWNYASNFLKNNFTKNFQLNGNVNRNIETGSNFLLKNYTVSIADVFHVIVPQFLTSQKTDYLSILSKLSNKSDLVFKLKSVEDLDIEITDEIDDEIYWLNFLAIESDGTYFKTANLIKDVSKPYFVKIIKVLKQVNYEFMDYLNSKYSFNLYSIYHYLPVKYISKGNRKVPSPKNEALTIFKDVLEHRSIDKSILFRNFTKYLICQRSGQFDPFNRHNSYGNVQRVDQFDFAIKNAVFNYLAFIQALLKLNLLNHKNMENNQKTSGEESGSEFGKRIEEFFDKMEYSETQKALFYLGRVLSRIAFAQSGKGHETKPVLNKINYNGMDKNAIIRLRNDLADKARQYKIVNKTDFDFSRFTDFFKPNDEKELLNPEENLFYLLSGYSFGMIKDDSDKKGNQNNNE